MFMVVTTKPGTPAPHMHSSVNESDVLKYIRGVGSAYDDPRKVSNVFEVSATGSVTHYEVVFDGKLSLRPIPTPESREDVTHYERQPIVRGAGITGTTTGSFDVRG